MENKELLEAAAKAADISPARWVSGFEYLGLCTSTPGPLKSWWNPLTDDGDALRLAVKLELFDLDRLLVDLDIEDAKTATNRDPYEATRRAIVLAASKVMALPSNDEAHRGARQGASGGADGSAAGEERCE